MRGGSVIILIAGALFAAVAAAAMPTWEHGLMLLDTQGPDIAAHYLHPFLQNDSDHLDLLDAWARLEHRRCRADSVAAAVRAAAPGAHQPAARHFLAGLAHRGAGRYTESVAEFEAAAATSDPLWAALATLRALRVGTMTADRPRAAETRTRFDSLLAGVDLPTRLQIEVDLLVADLMYMADDLASAEAQLNTLLQATTDFPSLAARIHNSLGGVAAKQRRLDEADHHYLEAERLARRAGDPELLATILKNRGYQAANRRELDRATRLLAEADSVSRRWRIQRLRGSIRSGQGAVAEMAGDRVTAVACFREAAQLCAADHDVMSEVGSRQRLAYSLGLLGEYSEARAEYETCLQLLDQHQSQFIRSWVVIGLALMEHKLGHLDRAAELYAEARRLSLDFGDHLSAAWCLNSLGLIQTLRGDYRQALLTAHEALQQYELAGDAEGMGEAHASMAEVYLELGDLNCALDHGRQAFAQAEVTGSQELLLRSLRNLAAVSTRTAPVDETTRLFRRAITIADQWSDRVAEARIWNGLAAHQLAHADSTAARHSLDQAQRRLPAGAHHQVRARTALLRGGVAPSSEDAIGWAEQALAEAEAAGLPGLEWAAHSDLGWYLHLNGQHRLGLEHQQRAVELVEGLRWRVGADELRRHMLRTAILPFERLIAQLMVDPARAAEALAVSERSRAQILTGRLRAALAHVPDTAAAGDPVLDATLTYLQSRLQDGDLDAADRDSIRARVKDVEREASLVRLRQPDQASPFAPQEAVTLQAILTPGEHALSYVLGAHGSFLFSVSPDTVRAYRLPHRDLIEAKVQRFLDLQAGPLPDDVMASARAQLHRLLLAPALADLETGARIFLVLDGLLHRLPFVYLGDSEPLVRRHQVCRVPSLQTLGYLRQRAAAHGERSGAVVAVGSRGGGPGRRHPFRDQPVSLLPAAEAEARMLGEVFANVTVLVGDQATEPTVRGQLHQAQLIHFAAHSDVDQVDVRRTHLVLNRTTGPDDGLLMWPEIVTLSLSADLVTLASCRSADGVMARGEGIGGLAQAFLHAGSRCVLGSTIDMPDRDARRLMRHFYRYLAEGLTAAAALRQVQLDLLDNSAEAQLRHAGEGLVLVGDGAVVPHGLQARRSRLVTTSLLALVLGLIGCVTLVMRRSK